jgi:hypothetical protein
MSHESGPQDGEEVSPIGFPFVLHSSLPSAGSSGQ